MEQKDLFELEITRENMEVDLAELDEALSPADFGTSISLSPDKVY
ncbi:MAG: hypothetical protein ABS939_06225 [Psychrobacillus sp.]